MDFSKPVVLLDLSSYIFYRYYAIQRWIIISKRELTSEETYEKFEKMFEDCLKKIVKKYKTSWDNVILARDCPRDKIWRMQYFEEYKKNRDMKAGSFDSNIFPLTYNQIIPKMQNAHAFKVIQYDRAEADDVIAVIHSKIRRDNPDTIVYVLSQDSDFLQLQDNRTNIRNFSDKLISETVKPEIYKVYLRWKIIRGDVSDNIPAIDKKIGDVTALKLANDTDLLQQKLNTYPQVRERYLLNDLLINFQNIPDDLREGIQKLI